MLSISSPRFLRKRGRRYRTDNGRLVDVVKVAFQKSAAPIPFAAFVKKPGYLTATLLELTEVDRSATPTV